MKNCIQHDCYDETSQYYVLEKQTHVTGISTVTKVCAVCNPNLPC